MNIKTRVKLYKDLEKKRGNPLIVYVTSQRGGAFGSMASDSINELIDQMRVLPEKMEAIDFLIESTGGDGLTAWRIAFLLRSKAKKVNILIPHSAYSAATMLALCGNEIIMGKYGCLGPIDPQITVRKKDGSIQQFAYEDIVAFLDFTKKEAGLTEQAYIESAFKILCDTVDPSALGLASRSSSQAVYIGEKLLQSHMENSEEKIQAKSIAEKLNKSFFSHGHSLSREEAKNIGLNVVEPDAETENIMWKIHESFNEELEARKPFNPISEFLSDPNAEPYLKSPPPLHLPSQIDPEVARQMMINHIQQQLSITTPDVVRELKYAFLESTRKASEFTVKTKILVTRTANMDFISNAVVLDGGWKSVEIKEEKNDKSVLEDKKKKQ